MAEFFNEKYLRGSKELSGEAKEMQERNEIAGKSFCTQRKCSLLWKFDEAVRHTRKIARIVSPPPSPELRTLDTFNVAIFHIDTRILARTAGVSEKNGRPCRATRVRVRE